MTVARLVLAGLGFLLIGFGCKKNPVVPPDNIGRDPRTYTWKRDTLGDGSRQSNIWSIWGSSANDVYFVGHSSSLFVGKLWHYDGSQYADITPKYIEAFPGEQLFNFSCMYVYGFSPGDVWVVGGRDTSSTPAVVRRGFVMHYDGSQWQGIVIPGAHELLTVGGISSSNLVVGGWDGLAYHYNGSTWQLRMLPDTISLQRFAGVVGDLMYFTGLSYDSTSGVINFFLLSWNGSTWEILESEKNTDASLNFGLVMSVSEGVLYSSIRQEVKKRVSPGNWQSLFSNSQASFVGTAVSSPNNIFSVGGPSGEVVYNYNGNEWYRFPQFDNPNIYDGPVWTDGKEVFIGGTEVSAQTSFWPKSFVLHGR